MLVKTYLDRKEINDSRFKVTMPREDWVSYFMKRRNLVKRVADNVQISRAIVNKNTIDEFFDIISEELEGIPLYNYDPDQKTVIKKGHGRRVERK